MSVNKEYEKQFKDNIFEKCTEYRMIELKELAPFEWDKVFIFGVYIPKHYIYEKVGYKWGPVNEASVEGISRLVFMNKGEVVCYIFDEGNYYINSDVEELYFSDNPKFIVRHPFGKESARIFHNVLTLNLIDDFLIENMPSENIDSSLVGEWELSQKNDNENSILRDIYFIITVDGIIYGRMWYSSDDYNVSGDIQFIGSLNEDIGECKTFSLSRLTDGDNPFKEESFRMQIKDNKFEVNFSSSIFLVIDNEKLLEVDGKYIVEKAKE